MSCRCGGGGGGRRSGETEESRRVCERGGGGGGGGGLARNKLPGVVGNLSLQEEQERAGVWRVEDVAWCVHVF